MISACVMLLVAGTGFGLKWEHINLLVWQSKHFKCRAACERYLLSLLRS